MLFITIPSCVLLSHSSVFIFSLRLSLLHSSPNAPRLTPQQNERPHLSKKSQTSCHFSRIFLCQRKKTAINISCEYTEGATLAEEELKKWVACICIPSTYSHRSLSPSFMFVRERSFQFSSHQCQEHLTCFLIWCPHQQRVVMCLWLPELCKNQSYCTIVLSSDR